MGTSRRTDEVIKMAEQNTQAQQQAVVLVFGYRRTGMGGFDDVTIISFRTKKPVSSRLHTSRSGRHDERTFKLLPAKYLLYKAQRSNLGNTYITVSVIEVTPAEPRGYRELQSWRLYDGKSPTDDVQKLPQNIRELLISNKEELPLFCYVEEYLTTAGGESE